MNIFKWIWVAITMFPRDLKFTLNYFEFTTKIAYWNFRGWTVHQVFDRIAIKNPNKIALRMEETAWTFQMLKDYSLQVANHFKDKGLQKGDAVAIFMENQPRYVGLWLGLTRLGVICALLNTKLQMDGLKHSIKVSESKAVIIGTDLLPAIQALQESEHKLDEKIVLYTVGPISKGKELAGTINLDPLIDEAPSRHLDSSITKQINMYDKMLYIYTSGTTGLPKAAVMNYHRFIFIATSNNIMLDLKKSDILYAPLPLYHAAGGLVATGQTLLDGITMVFRQKFSVTNYFPDCRKYGATVAQYVGQICQNLMNIPESKNDKRHKLRLMYGNGLRAEIWDRFKSRYGIKRIAEFYGSTEGNANLINTENKSGAVGFMPWYASWVYPLYLLEYSPETGEPIRDQQTGLCKVVARGKPGILVGKIKEKSATSSFSGYADKEATDKKIIKDVFKKGDKYFNSGDALKQDDQGYFYFVDRLGDTYRWKEENVAASEVENIISLNMNIPTTQLAVYGVEVPHHSGRAGMAIFAMAQDNEKLDTLKQVTEKHMFAAQTPVFVRFTSELPMTSTEKVKKKQLQDEGFNPSKVTDPLFVMKGGKYVPLTADVFQEIEDNKIRL